MDNEKQRKHGEDNKAPPNWDRKIQDLWTRMESLEKVEASNLGILGEKIKRINEVIGDARNVHKPAKIALHEAVGLFKAIVNNRKKKEYRMNFVYNLKWQEERH